MRIERLSVGMWRILKTLMDIKKCRAIVDISKACLLPLLMGTPLATMYASPMVSTLSKRIKMKAVSTVTIYEEQCTNKCNPPLSHTLVYWLEFGSVTFTISVSMCGREQREGRSEDTMSYWHPQSWSIVCFTLSRTTIYKADIVLYWRWRESSDWYRKLFTAFF